MAQPGAEPLSLLDRVDRGVAKVEGFLLVVVLAIMVGLASLQFLLRLAFDFSFDWGDIVVRHMVLWLTFLGGALATHQGRHIAIDAVSRLIAPKKAAVVRAFNSAIAAFICCVLVYASFLFLSDEIEDGSTVFGEVPTWLFEVIIPVGFIAITFHFLVEARNQTLIALGKREAPAAHADDIDKDLTEEPEPEPKPEPEPESESESESESETESDSEPESETESEPEPEPEPETESESEPESGKKEEPS